MNVVLCSVDVVVLVEHGLEKICGFLRAVAGGGGARWVPAFGTLFRKTKNPVRLLANRVSGKNLLP